MGDPGGVLDTTQRLPQWSKGDTKSYSEIFRLGETLCWVVDVLEELTLCHKDVGRRRGLNLEFSVRSLELQY